MRRRHVAVLVGVAVLGIGYLTVLQFLWAVNYAAPSSLLNAASSPENNHRHHQHRLHYLHYLHYLHRHYQHSTSSSRSTCTATEGSWRLVVDRTTDFRLDEFVKEVSRPAPSHLRTVAATHTVDETFAVCEWFRNSGTIRMPHEMEQLYRCWSYWQAYPDRVPVLYRAADAEQKRNPSWFSSVWYSPTRTQSPFVQGLLEAWLNMHNDTNDHDSTTILLTDDAGVINNHTSVRKGDWTYFGGHGYRWRSYHDARALRTAVLNSAPFRTTTTNNNTTVTATGGCSSPHDQSSRRKIPTVGLLNRRTTSYRSLLNAVQVQEALQEALGSRVNFFGNNQGPVYFEEASFAEQVSFFASVDLVVAPHGAQLVGIPFLTDCAAVLEIFPKNYYYQAFFGSLAEASAVKQYTLYLDESLPDDKTNFTPPDLVELPKSQRKRYRQVQLCPSIERVVEAVTAMVDDWELCCNDVAKKK